MGFGFNLLGVEKEYPDNFDIIAGELGAFVARANDSFNNFLGIYQSNKNQNEVIYFMQGQALGIINEMSNYAIGILANNGVNMTLESFTVKYQGAM